MSIEGGEVDPPRGKVCSVLHSHPPMNAEARSLIDRLALEPLPHEGGFFRRTWTSRETLAHGRPAGSAIFFFLTESDFSALHRLTTDELWLFHSGDPVEHTQLLPQAKSARTVTLGSDVLAGQAPQLIVPGGAWQGARLAPSFVGARRGWALLTCTMAPGWDEQEFILGQRAELLRDFPLADAVIRALTR